MNREKRSWLREWGWLLLVLVALSFYMRSRGAIRIVPAERAPVVGELVLRDPSGTVVVLSEHRGEVLLLNLWASWCGPCRREVPRLSRLNDELGRLGLRVWAINAESFSGEELRRHARDLGIDYPVAEPLSGLESLGGGDVLPYIWLIDRQGRLRAGHGGLARESALRKACHSLLDEPG